MKFLSNIWKWIKEHPWETAIIVVGGLLAAGLLSGFFGGGSSGGSSTSTGPDDTIQAAEIQASAQLQAASIAAGVTNNQTNAQTQLGQAYLNEQEITSLATDQLQLDLTNANNAASIQALELNLNASVANDIEAIGAKGLPGGTPVSQAAPYEESIIAALSKLFTPSYQINASPTTTGSVLGGTGGTSLNTTGGGAGIPYQTQVTSQSVIPNISNASIAQQIAASGINLSAGSNFL